MDRYDANGMSGEGAFDWGRAYGTNYQVDRQSHGDRPDAATDAQRDRHSNELLTLAYQALVK